MLSGKSGHRHYPRKAYSKIYTFYIPYSVPWPNHPAAPYRYQKAECFNLMNLIFLPARNFPGIFFRGKVLKRRKVAVNEGGAFKGVGLHSPEVRGVGGAFTIGFSPTA